jgi:hypothetical protein
MSREVIKSHAIGKRIAGIEFDDNELTGILAFILDDGTRLEMDGCCDFAWIEFIETPDGEQIAPSRNEGC